MIRNVFFGEYRVLGSDWLFLSLGFRIFLCGEFLLGGFLGVVLCLFFRESGSCLFDGEV